MRTPLDKILRGKLEKTVEKARDIVEVAVTEALTRLGISEGNAPSYLSEAERKLRTHLRAHGRQLGDVLNRDTGKQETELLVNEMAYEHWHRMLFARFLEQSDLLMYDQYTHVTLAECFELAEEEPDVKDGWELAGQLAQKMLPQIFRADSPVFEVKLSINHINALEELIADLHKDTFQASDALGWCYQFWQKKRKDLVNESGVDIGAKELSPVTQLFTEPYMVSFLLDNALGAWWAKRRLTSDDLQTATSEQELRERAAIPGVPLEYLRFVQDEDTKVWSNAAGDFEKWPEDLSELKTLDPCCGSGHFLVAKFLMLVPMRMELEALTAKQAIDKVIAENIHGLELDQRCVELAAFALALEAWRYPDAGGYRQLPELQLACSGMSITEAQKEWKNIEKGDEELQDAIQWMQQTFKDAPTLGSLINPTKNIDETDSKPWELIQKAVLSQSNTNTETITMIQGISKVSKFLAAKYSWVVTNVPYLGRGKQSNTLQLYCEANHPEAKNDLATVFLERSLKLCAESGSTSVVLPQNWLFLSSYKKFREKLLKQYSWSIVARLGEGGFSSSSAAGAFVALISLSRSTPRVKSSFVGVDASLSKTPSGKSESLLKSEIKLISQNLQLQNPDSAISLSDITSPHKLLMSYGRPVEGAKTIDIERFRPYFWNLAEISCMWNYHNSSPTGESDYTGLHFVSIDRSVGGPMSNLVSDYESVGKKVVGWLCGQPVWGKQGVSVAWMRNLPCSLYVGSVYDNSAAALVSNDVNDLPAIYCYMKSEDYSKDVRKINQKTQVATTTLGKVPFDKKYWSQIAKETYPNGLPEPYSNDATQWIFHGHPCASVIWNEETKITAIGELRQDDTVLQVTVARLLGYRWPAELDTEMELAPEMREIIAQNKVFDGLVDDDGIVCIPAIRGEKPAVDRLEAILHAAYGDKWSATVLNNLLKSVKSRDLNIWLRDKFFEQHCKLFQHRPFIWHIWDGLPDGFSALVNYHQLDYKGLERLIYTYLDDWISTQIQLEKDGDEGAEIRLAAARNLRKQLEDILVGEKGLDIFVRWKPLAEQPIGWNPDLNDGVRLNIRPFMKAKNVGKKDAGILRSKPNIHWKKDRGTDVESAPWYDLGLEYGGKQGDRINDHHLTLAEKKAARDKV